MRVICKYTGGVAHVCTRSDIMLCTQEKGTLSNDPTSPHILFSTLYLELHKLAQRELARQWNPLSLGVTTLLHEAYLDISARDNLFFPDNARFIGYAARVMRGLVIDHVRSRDAMKRGKEFQITSLEANVA